MIEHQSDAEYNAVLSAARLMCAAARTAPKTKGVDHIVTAILTGAEKDALADKMAELAQAWSHPSFARDGGNIRQAAAVVLIGTTLGVRGLSDCGFCGFETCAGCARAGGRCAYDSMDLGIALGSAAATAADLRMDNRIMFSAGRAALEMKLLGEGVMQAIGIPLSATGKSVFFDRK